MLGSSGLFRYTARPMELRDSGLRKGRAVFIALVFAVLLLLAGNLAMSLTGELKARWTSAVGRSCVFFWLATAAYGGSVWGLRLLLAWMALMLGVSLYLLVPALMVGGRAMLGLPVGLSLLGSLVVSSVFLGLMLLYPPVREYIGHKQEEKLREEAGA